MAVLQKTTDVKRLALIANDLRADIIKMLVEAGSGHSAGPMGLADIFACLYFSVLNHDPQDTAWDGRDRFILSPGHCAPVRYAAMAHAGFFPREELKTLRKLGSRLQGHVDRAWLPGLENTNASLGQGVGVAAGMALAAKKAGKPHTVFVCVSDGECDEGSTWEAAMFASHYALDNLIAFVDRNDIQICGSTCDVMNLEPFVDKWRSFGWNVLIADGHNIPEILKAFDWAKANRGSRQPSVIIFETIPGKGVSFMQGTAAWHGKPPNKEEAEDALAELAGARCELV
ncbi:MAG: transketolase [Candidatus Micrarchaeota archaeon]